MINKNILVVTRKELYNQVWATPMTRLAKNYKLSDVGLAKLCKELNIPRPGVGHWAKVAAGKPVKRRRLPAAKKNEPTEIRFNLEYEPQLRAQLPPEIESEIQEAEAELAVEVKESLVAPHPLVENTLRTLQGNEIQTGHLEHRYRSPCLDLRVSESALDRALRIVDALIRASEQIGVTIEVAQDAGREMKAVKDGVGIKFWLHEKV